jgi:hypothetical protein
MSENLFNTKGWNVMNEKETILTSLRSHLLYLLRGGGAHMHLDEAVKIVPVAMRGKRPDRGLHSPWELLEHMRIAQWDILEFSRNPGHVSPSWPEGYWPQSESAGDDKAWDRSIRAFKSDLKAMQELVEDPAIDLFASLPCGEGQTILREALLVADHNAYHLGQLVYASTLLKEK